MIPHYPPFLIHEADFALYLADSNGNAGSTVYMGGRLEDLQPETEFVSQRLDRHGDPFGNTIHVDERHRFTVKNLWALSRATGSMPKPRRNQKYIFVVRWFDPETTAWAKRSYFGVTADGQRLPSDGQVMRQNVPFTASFMIETSGRGTQPDLLPVTFGTLRYVSDTESIDLYEYDFDSGAYSVIDAARLSGRCAIVEDTIKWQLVFAGNIIALKATSTDLQIGELTAVGGTFATGAVVPRIEWWNGPRRLASLTAAGELAVPDAEERDTDPTADAAFVIKVNGAWCASIAPGRAYALEFNEAL
jgi:hypothetical protein